MAGETAGNGAERKEAGLDPADWDGFRAAAHGLLEACIDRLVAARDHPWQPVPEAVRAGYAIGEGGGLGDGAALADRLAREVLPYGTGNTHPRFFGWVHGTGLATGVMSEMVAATMNANCGGRDHGAVYMERAVIDWVRRVMGFPDTASGVLVGGTSQATVICLAAARVRALGPEVRRTGNGGARLVAYAGGGVHAATRKAMELLGLGSGNLVLIPETDAGIDVAALRTAIQSDRSAGAVPFAVVGTAGSVDLGRFDDLEALADLAADEAVWLHVDGAFGAWTRLADPPWQRLSDGIGRADSLACDFHKWMYVPYDCAIALIRDERLHRAAFAARPAYLEGAAEGVAGGDPWYCDYGVDLSRGNRALKVWTALQAYGAGAFGAAITGNCVLARYLGEQVSAAGDLGLVRRVVSNICVFTVAPDAEADLQGEINARVVLAMQMEGVAVCSTTRIDGIVVVRVAITNHRTRPEDIDFLLAAVRRIRDR